MQIAIAPSKCPKSLIASLTATHFMITFQKLPQIFEPITFHSAFSTTINYQVTHVVMEKETI